MRRKMVFRYLLSFFLLPVAAGFGFAQEIKFEAETPIQMLAADRTTQFSAVETIGNDDKYLLVADDKKPFLEIVEAKTVKIVAKINLPQDKTASKWEALARDDAKGMNEGEGDFYYVIGAHRYQYEEILCRFKMTFTDGKISTPKITEFSEWKISGSLGTQVEKLKKEFPEGAKMDTGGIKVKVEGLAVRTELDAKKNLKRREFVIGLREPFDPVFVLKADITIPPADKANLVLEPFFSFAPGNLKDSDCNGKGTTCDYTLSSIEYAPAWHGFLILTSNEHPENNFHGNILWFLPDEQINEWRKTTKPQKISKSEKISVFNGKKIKAEGICVLSATADKLRAALVYDNDNNLPSLLQYITLTKGGK